MFKRIGIAVLSLLLIAQSVPLAALAAEDPVVTTTPESTSTTTTSSATNTPANTPVVVSTTPETTTTTEANTNESEEDDDEVVDTTNDSDLDLHKNLEGIVRQSEPYTCGPAALATLLSQLGDDTTEADVLNFAPASKIDGVSLFALKQATLQLGHSVVLKKWTPEQLATYLKDSEDPVLIHDIKQDVGGHFSVVRDIKDGTVSLSDTEAGNITYSFSDFSKVFTGYTLIVDPDIGSPTSSSNLLLSDTSTNLSDEEAQTITGKYVPVAIAAQNNGASAAANTFSQCMKTASFQPTTALRRTQQSQCYQTLGAALSEASISTEATIAFQAGQSITGIDMAKDLQYTIDSDTLKKLNDEKNQAQTTVTTAQQKLQQAKETVAKTQATLEQAKTKQQQVLQANAVLQGKKTDYQNQLANKQSTLQALNSQISSAKLSLGSINASITAASSNLGSLSRTLQAKLTNTQSQITSKQSTLRSLQQEITQRQNTINNYTNQINTLQNTIAYKKSRRQSYSYEQNQLNNLTYYRQSEQSSLNRAQTAYNLTYNDITNLQQQLSSGNNQVALEQAALNALKQKQSLAQQDLDRKQAELPRIQNDITILAQALNKLPQSAPVPPVDYTAYNQAVTTQNQAQTAYNSAVTAYNQAVQAIQDEKNFIDSQERVLDSKIERDAAGRAVAPVGLLLGIDMGILKGAYSMYQGTITMIVRPVATVQSLTSAITNYDQTAKFLYQGLKERTNEVIYVNPGSFISMYRAGTAIGLTAMDVCSVVCVPGEGAAIDGVEVASMVVDVSKGVDEATQIAKISKTLKATAEAQDVAVAAKTAMQMAARAVAKAKNIFYNYAQDSINIAEKFSDGGLFANKTVDELVADLQSGRILPSQVPINFVERNGIRVVENTRSVVAMERSGISPDLWNWQNAAKDQKAIDRIDANLASNKLPQTGIDRLKFR